MYQELSIAVIIPATGSVDALRLVARGVPAWADDVVIVTDGAVQAGVNITGLRTRMVAAPRPGLKAACLAGIAALDAPDVVIFLPGDGSALPEEIPALVGPILRGEADLVIGSRWLRRDSRRAMPPVERWSARLTGGIMRYVWRDHVTDADAAFRAVRWEKLRRLRMEEVPGRWGPSMLIRARRRRVRCAEVPVRHRARLGAIRIAPPVWTAVRIALDVAWTTLALSRRGPADTLPPARRRRVIVFTRYPERGRSKTRMIPLLGPEGAATLQRDMTTHTMDTVRRFCEEAGASFEVRHAAGERREMAEWLGGDVLYQPQEGVGLGERMRRAMQDAMAGGAERVVIVGTDCPELSGRILAAAFHALRPGGFPVVIGPAHDGGYYLIGMSRLVAPLFRGIEWGTEFVLPETLAKLETSQTPFTLLPPLHDVDRPEDHPRWEAARAARRARSKRPPRPPLSVIIPTLNESDQIGVALRALSGEPGIEIIVVDGGSTDDTVAQAREHAVRVIETRLRNRARQMNAGAERARGDALLFLHADTRLPANFAPLIARALARPGVVAGAFPLRFDEGGAALRFLAATANWRARRRQMPYGDQGIFMRRRTFAALGGFRPLPVMEDFDLMERLRRRGRIILTAEAAVTSARRYRKRGLMRTWLTHKLMTLGWRMGVSPATLARWRGRTDAMALYSKTED